MTDEPRCPSEECRACTGEACHKCGAGCWSHVRDCEHDVTQRHEKPDTKPRAFVIFDIDPRLDCGGQTFYCGGDPYDGSDETMWLPDLAKATRFGSRERAQVMIEDCDQDEVMRDRLVILEVEV